MKKKLISVVVPVYRNEGTLYKTYISLISVLRELLSRYAYEIIFINDGSDDNSLNELLKIKKVDRNVTVIDFVRNFGQQSAILAGFQHAKGNLLIHISADLQDPPDLITKMIEKWNKGYKVVACARIDREDDFISKITSKIFYSLIKVAVPKMPAGGFDYFLVDNEVYKRVLSFDERNSFIQGDLLWLGYEPYFIKYKRLKRVIGKSQWNFTKKIKYFIDGFINTSYLPIRIMSFIGVMTSFLGFIYALVVLFARLFNDIPFQGYAPIMIVLLIASGLIMMMLGVIGEYLWRIYDEIRKRPQYLIKKLYL
ncbi:MAG: hypothetical protein A3C30_00465 [Candidatus Levybacteria bacterium RIFCSPHIGHO2_02_FULL_40_18]|nr:MAG: hypothetical protein A2869_04160 [Candidatus Levybacteria bacterium RIFCSPHIGHO2_01_FULL_40_58]OGH27175.1 MAG: hypothetical protein A3C30_00465 [Candidatus Levybacteria bacterium RIFCSPHIGHO2_02_FULL_40_18]OGH31034.1 MAG: hypothetical protein A3E43_04880 [Candidatus Levybacteria bacterium RIFCSPHIGHO2_12_FULL_40_31]OGH41045.1 MAG: hypothetical protein A2894_02095 [Candidatus Levybacteria bacterium RIFCSPLOWO2_01_FULL_40_64]OGH49435.1 MAG: hypothetical protein A3I54_02200 [Candidatus Lev